MNVYRESITDFGAELSKYIILSAPSIEAEGVYKIETNRCCIYIYLPQALRRENAKNLPTIHIDVDQIINCSTKLIKRLKGLHGLGSRIYARQTVVARIDKKTTMDFLEEHHLNDAFPGKYRFGLFYNGELVSVAVFSGGRLMREEGEGHRSFELIRFCHKGDSLVVGGLSKLLKSFVKSFDPQDIMTYADLDWTEESSLDVIGFKPISRTIAQQFYIVNGMRKSRLTEEDKEYYTVINKGSLKLKLLL